MDMDRFLKVWETREIFSLNIVNSQPLSFGRQIVFIETHFNLASKWFLLYHQISKRLHLLQTLFTNFNLGFRSSFFTYLTNMSEINDKWLTAASNLMARGGKYLSSMHIMVYCFAVLKFANFNHLGFLKCFNSPLILGISP